MIKVSNNGNINYNNLRIKEYKHINYKDNNK